MCRFGDLDPCEVWRETPRIARKTHVCDGCYAIIQPHEAYVSHFNVFEGEASHEAMCFGCWVSREEFADAHDQNFAPSNLWTFLQECIGENDDPLDEWRSHFAGMKHRYRNSPSRRRDLLGRREVQS